MCLAQGPQCSDALLKDHNAVTPVRLVPTASQSRVKHSTTEPVCAPIHKVSEIQKFAWQVPMSLHP